MTFHNLLEAEKSSRKCENTGVISKTISDLFEIDKSSKKFVLVRQNKQFFVVLKTKEKYAIYLKSNGAAMKCFILASSLQYFSMFYKHFRANGYCLSCLQWATTSSHTFRGREDFLSFGYFETQEVYWGLLWDPKG